VVDTYDCDSSWFKNAKDIYMKKSNGVAYDNNVIHLHNGIEYERYVLGTIPIDDTE